MGCLCNKAAQVNELPRSTGRKNTSQYRRVEGESPIFFKENPNDFFSYYILTDKALGRGPYSETRVCVHRHTSVKRAVKIILRKGINGEDVRTHIMKQVETYKQLEHPNLVKVYEFFSDRKYYYIVEDLCTGQNLLELMAERVQLTEIQVAAIMKQVFSALEYLHANQITHRDIRLRNVMVLIGDGGVPHCRVIGQDTAMLCSVRRQLRGSVGASHYIAPEVLADNFNEKCDLWSCGIMLYIMLSGTPPFNGITDKDVLECVTKAKYEFDEATWQEVSPDAKALVSQLLLKDSAIRLSAQQASSSFWIASQSDVNQQPRPIAPESRKRLKNFHETNKLMQAMHTFIISQIIVYDEVRELKEAFSSISPSGNSYIEQEELLRIFLNFMSPLESRDEVSRIFREIDTDNAGYMDYSVFLKVIIDHKLAISQRNLKHAFSLKQKEDRGLITTLELRMLFENNDYMEDEIWENMIKEVDQNKHGEIDLFEFEFLLRMELEAHQDFWVNIRSDTLGEQL
jgi:calcium-dependent protein kinase